MYYGRSIAITSAKGFLKLGCAAIVLGMLLFVMAFLGYMNEKDFAETAKYTTGTVIGLTQKEFSNRTPGSNITTNTLYYYPVVSFAVDKHNYTFTSGSGNNPPLYNIGQNVNIMYDPQNPLNADINSWSNKWLSVIICISLGGMFTGFGILFIVRRHKITN